MEPKLILGITLAAFALFMLWQLIGNLKDDPDANGNHLTGLYYKAADTKKNLWPHATAGHLAALNADWPKTRENKLPWLGAEGGNPPARRMK